MIHQGLAYPSLNAPTFQSRKCIILYLRLLKFRVIGVICICFRIIVWAKYSVSAKELGGSKLIERIELDERIKGWNDRMH